MRPSDRKTGLNDPISYTMIVSGLLKPFLAISDFFRLVSRPSHPLQVEKSWKFRIFGSFSVKNGRNCTFWGSFFGSKNRSKSSYIGRNFDFSAFLVTLV